jgi:hypothetical protein
LERLESSSFGRPAHLYDSKDASWLFVDDSSFHFSFELLDELHSEERERR